MTSTYTLSASPAILAASNTTIRNSALTSNHPSSVGQLLEQEFSDICHLLAQALVFFLEVGNPCCQLSSLQLLLYMLMLDSIRTLDLQSFKHPHSGLAQSSDWRYTSFDFHLFHDISIDKIPELPLILSLDIFALTMVHCTSCNKCIS